MALRYIAESHIYIYIYIAGVAKPFQYKGELNLVSSVQCIETSEKQKQCPWENPQSSICKCLFLLHGVSKTEAIAKVSAESLIKTICMTSETSERKNIAWVCNWNLNSTTFLLSNVLYNFI